MFRDVGADPNNMFHRMGNLSATSTSEVLGSARAYNEQASEAERSVKSTSASDDSNKEVTIVYLTSAYVKKTLELTLNGTTAVATGAADIRFIEDFHISKGAAAVGAIELWSNNSGGGTAITGIGVGTEQAFLPHHYVPAGKQAWVVGWGSVVDDDCAFKLKMQKRPNGTDLVDFNGDLDKVAGTAAIGADRKEFYRRKPGGLHLPEKTRCWVAVVPTQSSTTVIRTFLDIWEEDIPS